MMDGAGRGDEWERGLRDRLIAGDESAVADLYDQYASFVFGLARRVTGDRTAAEDVTQDVFVACWEKPEAFDPERGPAADVPRDACAPTRGRLGPA